MAELTIKINIPGWTPDELRQAVHDLDELEDPGSGIDPIHVKAWDIITFIALGELGFNEIEIPAFPMSLFTEGSTEVNPGLKQTMWITEDVIKP